MSKVKEESIHVFGNGRVCVYGSGAEILQIFGLKYSGVNFLELRAVEYRQESWREENANIWHHHLFEGEKLVAVFTDFLTEQNIFVRQFKVKKDIILNLKVRETIFQTNDTIGVIARKGGYFYHTYPTEEDYFLYLYGRNIKIEAQGEDEYKVLLKSDGEIYFEVQQDCMFKRANLSVMELLENERCKWTAFFERITPNIKKLPKEEKEIAKSVAILLKAQQSEQGGIIAGYNYHMAYVRDMYGSVRGMLSLGMVEEAEKAIRFFANVFKESGRIANAQAVGIADRFHCHEHDDVEITGLLILLAFDVNRQTGDVQSLKDMYPMLRWAYHQQEKNLYREMNSFNGDETYIAGGIVPRTVIDDGSAGATMMFLRSGELLCEFITKNELESECEIQRMKEVLNDVRGKYGENFLKDGKLLLNNPIRQEGLTKPESRNGVCVACNAYFGKVVKDEFGNYVCENCKGKADKFFHSNERLFLPSEMAMPFYFDSEIKDLYESKDILETCAKQFIDQKGASKYSGYEMGFLLFALVCLKSKVVVPLREKLCSLADSIGAWAEYYEDDIPMGTRCRPWESGINIEAIIKSFQ